MERDEKVFEQSLDTIIQRCQDLMKSLSSLLLRIDTEQMDFKDYLDVFASIQGSIASLMKTVKANMSNYVTRSIFPLKLTPTEDLGLAALTEGRLKTFNHDSAPDYLRTKYEPEVESRFKLFSTKGNGTSMDQAQKQITSANKIVSTLMDAIRSVKEAWELENRHQFQPTTSPDATYAMLSAVFNGKSLRQIHEPVGRGPIVQHLQQAPQQRPAPGKAAPSIKTNIKAANNMHPYNR